MAQQQQHPIFDDIERGDLAAVQQHVLASAAVLEERESIGLRTPLMQAIYRKKPAVALWIIEHRGQHDVEAAGRHGMTALDHATTYGLLDVTQALVAAGAKPAVVGGWTPLIMASSYGHTVIVAFLLQLPAVKASIDHINRYRSTALSYAAAQGHQPVVQLLLDAGADPTIPSGPRSPLYQALSYNHHAVAALLRHAIDEADRARALHKGRSLLGAGAAALACLQGRGEQGKAMPPAEVITTQQQQGNERLRATFAVGVSGREKDTGLCEDLYLKLLGYMVPAWADKGPGAEEDNESVELEEEDSGLEDDDFDYFGDEEGDFEWWSGSDEDLE